MKAYPGPICTCSQSVICDLAVVLVFIVKVKTQTDALRGADQLSFINAAASLRLRFCLAKVVSNSPARYLLKVFLDSCNFCPSSALC